MRVEILKKDNPYSLECVINEWIKEYEDSRTIIDIKYSGNGNNDAYSEDEYSAMIIYK